MIVGVFLTVLLLVVCVIIMTNTIKLTTLARKEEIAVMKMMGAYDGFVKLPFICEGCIVGLAGALIAFGFSIMLYWMMTSAVASGDGLISIICFAPITEPAAAIFVVTVVLGLGIGTAGSNLAVKQYLKL